MIKRCNNCGYWWTTEDGKTTVCQECGENHNIVGYSESEIVELLNKSKITINGYAVKDGKGDLLYVGSKEECERFVKNYETIFDNMTLEEIK